jgi:hypothetical protein
LTLFPCAHGRKVGVIKDEWVLKAEPPKPTGGRPGQAYTWEVLCYVAVRSDAPVPHEFQRWALARLAVDVKRMLEAGRGRESASEQPVKLLGSISAT